MGYIMLQISHDHAGIAMLAHTATVPPYLFLEGNVPHQVFTLISRRIEVQFDG